MMNEMKRRRHQKKLEQNLKEKRIFKNVRIFTRIFF